MQATTKAGVFHGSIEAVATVMLIASLVMGGSNGILASAVSLPSYQIVLLRATIGAAILGIMLLASRKPLASFAYKGEFLMAAGAGVALGADWLFLFEAYDYAGVGMSTVLCYCAPIIVMALSPVVFGEKFTPAKTIGFAIVVAGALLVNGSALQGGSSPYGIACGLASAVCFAAMMMLSKKAVHIAGIEKVFIEIAAAAAMVGVYSLVIKGASFSLVLGIGASDIVPLALLGISTALANYLYLKSLSVLSAQSVSVLGYAEPLSAVLFGAVVLGESMLPIQMAGAGLIVLGALASELGSVSGLRLRWHHSPSR